MSSATGHQRPPETDRRTRSKADQVYAQVKESILSGMLSPGSAIDKVALCQRLNVSRFPVSAAINRLAYERLVVIEPQHGSFVARLAISDMREWMMIRRALEIEIVGELALDVPEAARSGLERNLRYQQAACDAADSSGFYALDVEFHRLLVGALGLRQVVEILEGLRSHLERLRRLLLAPPDRMINACAEHQRIVAAMEAGDRAGAQEAMRTHLDQTTRLFENFALQFPDLFTQSPSQYKQSPSIISQSPGAFT